MYSKFVLLNWTLFCNILIRLENELSQAIILSSGDMITIGIILTYIHTCISAPTQKAYKYIRICSIGIYTIFLLFHYDDIVVVVNVCVKAGFYDIAPVAVV